MDVWGIDLFTVLTIAAVIRAVLMGYAEVHDRKYPSFKFTDIDYGVFTEGAALLVAGRSPYECPTFRYPPIFAVAMVPNLVVHQACGKILFCAADLLAGLLLYRIGYDVALKTASPAAADRAGVLAAAGWLLNPLCATVSARGNADAVLAVVVLGVLRMLQIGWVGAAGGLYGVAVHLKLYPVLYVLPTTLFLSPAYTAAVYGPSAWRWRAVVTFTCGAITLLAAASVASYAAYGQEFFEKSYLYHFGRRDHRHNFSPYFYPMYLEKVVDYTSESGAPWLGIAALIIQAGTVSYAGWRLCDDLPFAWLIQTMAFVALNKVVTTQYFLWFLCLLPLSVVRLKASPKAIAAFAAVWLGSQAIWLQQAYQLEFIGQSNFNSLWLASLLVMWSLAAGIRFILVYHSQARFGPTGIHGCIMPKGVS